MDVEYTRTFFLGFMNAIHDGLVEHEVMGMVEARCAREYKGAIQCLKVFCSFR